MPNDTPQPDPATTPDPRVVHAEARLAKLREASDITLAVMRATGRQAIESLEPPPAPQTSPAPEPAVPSEGAAAPRPAGPRVDPVERLNRLTRNLRLTLALEAKLEDALAAYLAGEVVKVEAARERAAKDPDSAANDPFAPLRTGRRARVLGLVREAADAEIPDARDHDRITDALEERLLCDAAYDDIDDLPLRDIVESLCADLQLKPDWKRWTGEGWKPNPPFTRPLCSPFHEPSRRPVLDDDDDDPAPRE